MREGATELKTASLELVERGEKQQFSYSLELLLGVRAS